MFCPNCGTKIEPGTACFCPQCGKKLPPGARPDSQTPRRDPAPASGADGRFPQTDSKAKNDLWAALFSFTPKTKPFAIAFAAALGLLLLVCVFAPASGAIGDFCAVLFLVAGACAFFISKIGLKEAASDSERALCFVRMLMAAGLLIVAGFFIPVPFAVSSVLPALLSLGMVIWCLVLLLKIPKTNRTKQTRNLFIIAAMIGAFSVILPTVKISLYVMYVIQNITRVPLTLYNRLLKEILRNQL
ncbi:MAG: zinc ribbon domain-containing protein [Clostridia bacterium]|nr:zinc ribbon domain-containing protein [Clostridia bacterium]